MTRFARFIFALLLTSSLLLATAPARAAHLVIGGKNFTEQLLLAEITSQYLRSLGYTVDMRSGLGSVLMRSALESNQLDIVWDYTGTALIVYNRIHEKLDPQTAYTRVRDLDMKRGLIWLNRADLNNTYALAMPHERAERDKIETISQLAKKLKADPPRTKHWFAMDAEFANRPDGLQPLKTLYDLRLGPADIKQMDAGLVYTALHNNQTTIGLVYTTDGRIKGFGIKVLTDDLGFFPAYNATPIVRRAVLERHPKLASQLNALSARLNNEVMSEMTKRVDIGQESVRTVAADFLGANAHTEQKRSASLKAYFSANWQDIVAMTLQHLALVGIAVGCAIVIGVPLGILINHWTWLAAPLLSCATIVLTLPSIALFGLMIPLFSRFGAGIGAVPAIAAVFLYSLLPIMRNTYLALRNVDPGIREAGAGIGMTSWQRLRLVELPLAVPVIVGGIRTAVVMNIGVMTIAAIIGADGLGVLVLRAISQSNMPKLVIGAVLVSLLAIVADLILQMLQRALTPKGVAKS